MTIITLPDLISYPEILSLDQLPEFNNITAYVIKEYPLNGIAVLVYREKDDVILRIGDWNGNLIDVKNDSTDMTKDFLNKYSIELIKMMKYIGLEKALFYLTLCHNELMLVDVRIDQNKFTGPGMLRDLFSKIIKTQEVTKIVQVDNTVLEAIKEGKGNYSGNLILKSSAFTTIDRKIDGKMIQYPLYAKVSR